MEKLTDLKGLSDEMIKVKKQIETMLSITGYLDYDDLSGLSDYKQIETADERQKLEEYRHILYKLEEVQSTLEYLERHIREMGTLRKNSQGRYETESGYCYTSGSGIEFLRTEEVCNFDTNKWEKVGIWTTSRVESKAGDYYIVGYPEVGLSGLTVRVRK